MSEHRDELLALSPLQMADRIEELEEELRRYREIPVAPDGKPTTLTAQQIGLIQISFELMRMKAGEIEAQKLAVEEKLAALPADWSKDSSLQTWFPLTAEIVARLEAALEAATMSLETIDEQAGIDECLKTIAQIRGYAHSRATVARAALNQ